MLLDGRANLHMVKVWQRATARTPSFGWNNLEARDPGMARKYVLHEGGKRLAELLPRWSNHEALRKSRIARRHGHHVWTVPALARAECQRDAL